MRKHSLLSGSFLLLGCLQNEVKLTVMDTSLYYDKLLDISESKLADTW